MPQLPPPILDRSRLARQTMGSESLEVEVLALFTAEAERLLRQIEDAPDPQVRADRLRALVGLARNIGALRLAESARDVETLIGDEEPDLTRLRAAAAEVLSAIQRPAF